MAQSPIPREVQREATQLVERGAHHYAAGQLDEALAAWRQAAELAPTDVRARSYVAWGEFRKRAAEERAARERDEASTAERRPRVAEPDTERKTGELRSATARSTSESRGPSTAEAATAAAARRGGERVVTTGQRTTGEMVAPVGGTAPRSARTMEMPSVSAADLAASAQTPAAPTVGERVQDFLGRTPTRQNLRLVDVWELDDQTIADLATKGALRAGLASDDALEAQSTDPEERLRVARSLLVSAGQASERGDFNVALAHVERAVAFMGGLERLELGAEPLVTRVYEHHLGDRARTLIVADVPRSLEPRAAYLLSRVDGMMTVDDLIDISGMPRLEVIRRLALLLHEGALAAE